MTSPATPRATPPTDSPPDQAPESPEFVITLPDDPASGKDWYLWAGVLALLVFVAFFPAVRGDMLWDDDHHVGIITNPLNNMQSVDGLINIWTKKGATPQYYPLTFTSFWLEHKIWNDNLLGYHLVNLLLHAGAAVLIWRLLKRLALPGAWVAAAIWAIHPLQVESVCWLSERKNVLSGLLFFASIWFYLEFAGLTPALKDGAFSRHLSADGSTILAGNRWYAYTLALLCFVLALFAKTVACAMPAVMLILLWWKGRKILSAKTLVPLIPYFIFGLVMGAVTIYMETALGGTVEARGPDWDLNIIQRTLIAGRGLWFYAFKLIAPLNLTFSYPRVEPSAAAMGPVIYALQWLYVVGFIGVLAWLAMARKTIGRGPLAAVLYYSFTLFPALGFINIFPMRYSFVADHFQYLSGLGLIVLAVAVCSQLLGEVLPRAVAKPGDAASSSSAPRSADKSGAAVVDYSTSVAPGAKSRLIFPVILSVLLLLGLGSGSWLQAHIYTDQITLWRDTIAKNPTSWMASDNLGFELIKRGEEEERAARNERFQGLIDLANQDQASAQVDYKEAEGLFHHVLANRPQQYTDHNGLGVLYRQTGRWAEAEAELKTAVEMDQAQDDRSHQLTAPYVNYAQVMMHNHPDMDVRPLLKMALDLKDQPRIKSTDMATARLVLGQYLYAHAARAAAGEESKYLTGAIGELEAGLNVTPDESYSRYILGRAYQRLGLIVQAQSDSLRAAGNPERADQLEYESMNVDDGEAMRNFNRIVHEDDPWDANAYFGIGQLFARHMSARDSQVDAIQDLLRAMSCFQDALKIDPSIVNGKATLQGVKTTFMDEAAKALAADKSWAPLREKVQSLQTAAGDAQKNPSSPAAAQALAAAADEADRAAHTTLWSLGREHPLRQPLINLRVAIRQYGAALHPSLMDAQSNLIKPPADPFKALVDAIGKLKTTSDDLLKQWDKHDAARDAALNTMTAADCYEAVLTIDPQSPEGRQRLRSVIDAMQAAAAQKVAIPALLDRLAQAKLVLTASEAATQPNLLATQPVVHP